MKPTAILEKLCMEAGLEQPLYQPGCVTVASQRFYEQEHVENEQGLLFIIILSVLDLEQLWKLQSLKYLQVIDAKVKLYSSH